MRAMKLVLLVLLLATAAGGLGACKKIGDGLQSVGRAIS